MKGFYLSAIRRYGWRYRSSNIVSLWGVIFVVTIIALLLGRPQAGNADSSVLGEMPAQLQRTSGVVKRGMSPTDASTNFTFAVTVDERNYAGSGYDSSNYYRGALEALNARGKGVFMLSPGDIDPPEDSRWTIDQVLGTDYMWYPVVGNHEEETSADMAYLRAYDYDANGAGVEPDLVNTGPSGCPETTYSFDYGNAHFAVINEYCNESGDTVLDGDVSDHVYNWLQADLQATTKEHIFVIGHEPAFPQPDEDNDRLRHHGDSLDKYPARRDRFWHLLKDEGVVAYLIGHTHNYSVVKIDGVWQVDAGHARGAGDTGGPSTFIIVHVNDDEVTLDAYRDIHDGVYDYDDITHNVTLKYAGSPPAPPSSDIIDAHVIRDEDDAEELNSDGTMNLDSSDLELGKGNGWGSSGDHPQTVGIRFQNIQVPQGATITSAYIEFETDETSSEATSVTFYGEAADAPTTFSESVHNITDRPRTSASVAWNDIPAWNTVDEKHESPDLSAIVQEIVNRSGWQPGNSMSFFIEGAGKRVAESHDGELNAAPMLHIEYGSMTSTSFQDGVSPAADYAGTRDTTLSQESPDTNYGAAAVCYVDGDDPPGSGKDKSVIIRWDVSDINPGEQIDSASVTLHVVNETSGPYYLYELKREWAEMEATWNVYRTGANWETAGAKGAADRGSAILGTMSSTGTGSYTMNLNSAGIALVQAWVDDPASSFGIILTDPSTTNGADFDCREVSTPGNRPKLTVAHSLSVKKPALDISIANGTDIVLTWDDDDLNCSYEVYRQTTPYFDPDDTDPELTLDSPATTHTFSGDAGNPDVNYFYLVRALSCTSGAIADSIRTSSFDFALQPGSTS
jgi:hypothetical protein